ncbi:MAG: helix-turn-helix domain-containing protein [Luteolibacter sp.]
MDDLKDSLGTTLRTAREAAGISVDDAVYIAKLPRDVVHALENEDFGFFNSPLYARSFLQQYGDYVGVNVDPWLSDIEATAMIDGDDLDSFIDLSGPVVVPVLHEKEKSKKSGGNSMAVIWLILITAGLVYGGVKIMETLDSHFTKPEPVAENDDTPADSDEKSATQETATTTPAEEEPTAQTEPEAPKRAIVIELPEE